MDLNQLTVEMHRFVEAKGWYGSDSPRPQTLRNLAVSISIEAAEILELFQWNEDIPDREALGSELADVALYLLQLASLSEIDLEKAVLAKLSQNYGRHWEADEDSRA
ncbi:MAG: hypothetical protein JXA97_10265 [Anaerolineales bacterium]|nr:hypothetical protein [Anaerolineales bacterium]